MAYDDYAYINSLMLNATDHQQKSENMCMMSKEVSSSITEIKKKIWAECINLVLPDWILSVWTTSYEQGNNAADFNRGFANAKHLSNIVPQTKTYE